MPRDKYLTDKQLNELYHSLDEWIDHCNKTDHPSRYAIALAVDLQNLVRGDRTYYKNLED